MNEGSFRSLLNRISSRSPNVNRRTRGNLSSCGISHRSSSWHDCTACGTVEGVMRLLFYVRKFVTVAFREENMAGPIVKTHRAKEQRVQG